MKRLALILFVLFINALTIPASAYDVMVNRLRYELHSNGTAGVVSRYSDNYKISGSITIPEEIKVGRKVYRVTSIGDSAFSFCKSLMSVEIPNSVTYIGESAFYSCESLMSITIPSGVTHIGEGAFRYCKSLMSVTLPNSLQSIGAETFYSCESLENIVIPNSVTFIGVNAFEYCSSLKTITIPFSASLGNGVFKYCRALSKIIVSSDSYYTSSSLQEKYSSAISQIDTFRPRNVAVELATTNKSVNQATAKNSSSVQNNSTVNNNNSSNQNDSEFSKQLRLAEQGSATAQNYVGWCYENGAGVAKNHSEAYKWYMKAAEQGHSGAYNKMAYLYMEGNGVKKDERKAFEMIDKAIELSPDDTDYYDSKGELYSLLGDKEHALEMWNKIMSIDPKYAESKNTKFVTYIRRLQGGVDFDIPQTNYSNNTTFAVIIANESYNREEDVSYALNDGEIFSEYCSKTLGIPGKNIHLIKNATLNDIRHEVNWVTNVMDAYSGDAKVIFYYAGHGIPDERTKAAYLLPVDGYGSDVTTGYSLSDLYSTLGGVPSKSVIVLLDACFSGAKRDGTMLASSRGVAIKVNQENPIGNLIVFSASQGDETAFPYVEQGHGMFTYFILKKLQETKGNVTMGELSDYVTTQVKRESAVINNKPQTPTIIPSQTIATTWRNETMR